MSYAIHSEIRLQRININFKKYLPIPEIAYFLENAFKFVYGTEINGANFLAAVI